MISLLAGFEQRSKEKSVLHKEKSERIEIMLDDRNASEIYSAFRG